MLIAIVVLLLLNFIITPTSSSSSSSSSSYCYDNCSYPVGGACRDNVCRCNPGYHGENCKLRYAEYPELTVGMRNLTSSKEARELFASHESVLVGVSMSHCAKCAAVEAEYARANFTLLPFVRVDAAKHPALVKEQLEGDSPSNPVPFLVLVWSHGKRRGLYRGYQTEEALKRFEAMKGTSYARLPQEKKAFGDSSVEERIPLGSCAFVYHHLPRKSRGAEDEYEDWVELTEDFRSRHDILFFERETGEVSQQPRLRRMMPPQNPALFPMVGFGCRRHRRLPHIGPGKGAVVEDEEEDWAFVSLAERGDWRKWVELAAVPTGVPLTPETFASAEAASLPMLLLFTKEADSALSRVFSSLAVEYRGKVVLFRSEADGFMQKIEDLGGGEEVSRGRRSQRDRFPALFLNTKDQGLVRFVGFGMGETRRDLESAARMPAMVRRFLGEYLSGKRMSESSSSRRSSENEEEEEEEEEEGEEKDEEKDVPGVSEGFSPPDDATVVPLLSLDDYRRVALDETRDVLLLVHRSSNCPACRALAPFFKRLASRLLALRANSGHRIVVARLDLGRLPPDYTSDLPLPLPTEAGVPSVVMLPANAKGPPFRYYTGVTKVYPMMEWARVNCAHAFEFGEELPQFDSAQKILFKQQIREREEERRGAGEL